MDPFKMMFVQCGEKIVPNAKQVTMGGREGITMKEKGFCSPGLLSQ